MNNIGAGEKALGSPATNSKEALHIMGLTKRLPNLNKQLKQLCKRVDKLEAAKDN